MKKEIVLVAVFLIFSALLPGISRAEQSPGLYFHVLVVYNTEYTDDDNSNGKQDSLEIAEYYQEKRGIPDGHVCGINTSTSETISREQYDQWYDTGDSYPNNTHVRQAVEDCLVSRGIKETIRYITLAKGMPLRISTYQDTGYNAADYGSVDNALSLLFNNVSIYWRHTNPYYNVDPSFDLDERFDSFKYNGTDHYTPVDFNLSYLVTRLDGYNVTEVLDMIDRAVLTNTSMKGQWVLDDDPDCSGSTCDYMSAANATLCETLGLCDYVSFEDTNPALTSPEDVDNNSVIGYSSHGVYGSGLGSNAIESGVLTFDLNDGSIYTSWESFNARSYDDPDSTGHNMVADWIRFGGTGGLGSVYEPWCSGISHENYLFPAYASGYTFAEAAYMSLNYVDFVTSVGGDPIMTITPDEQGPEISISYPLNYTRMNEGGIINFSFFEDYPHKKYIDHNGTNISFDYPFSLDTSGWSTGIHNVTIYANDTRGKSITKTYYFEINSTTGEYPNFTDFDGNTTQFHRLEDRTNVSSAVLEKTGAGKIEFLESANFSGLDLNTHVNISRNRIGIDTVNLPGLNRSANLTITNLSYTHPVILRNGCVCSAPVCTSLNYSEGAFRFTVSCFTNYSASPNSQMTIWDESDTGMPYGDKEKKVMDETWFYANYTNLTSGLPITGADCTIDFGYGEHDMEYNSSGFYEYNMTFSEFGTVNYSVSCNASGYEPLNGSDDIFIFELHLEDAPVITNPSHGNVSSYSATNVTWDSEGKNFTLQIDDGPGFRSPEVNAAGIGEKFYCFMDNGVILDTEKDYHIRVKSNESGWGYLKSPVGETDERITENESGSHYQPSVAVDSNGTAHVAWKGGDNILYSNAKNWSMVTDITDDTSYEQYWPSLCTDEDGTVHVAWEGRKATASNPNILYANSANWSEKVEVSGPINYDQHGTSIGMDGSGIVHIAWHGKTSANPGYYNIRYANSANWTNTIEITDQNSNDNTYPSLAIGPDGTVHIAWYGMKSGDSSNHVRYANSKNWSAITEEIGSGGTQSSPSMKVANNGLVHVAYTGLKSMYMNIRYANNTNWTEEIKLTDQTDFDQMKPSLGMGSGENVHVAWYGRNSESPTIDNIFYANSTGWTDRHMVTNAMGDQQRVSLANNGEGVHLAWQGENEVHHTGNIGSFTTTGNESVSITVSSPANGTINSDYFNFTFMSAAEWALYSVDGAANVTNSSLSEWTGIFSGLSDGIHNVTVWANDSDGDMNSTVRWWTRDTIMDSPIINHPVNDTVNNDTFNFTFTEVNCSMYSLDGEANVTNCSVSGSEWSGSFAALSDGVHNVTVWVNDSVGNWNSSKRVWTRDTKTHDPDSYDPGTSTGSTTISIPPSPQEDFSISCPSSVNASQGKTSEIRVIIENTGETGISEINLSLDIPESWNSSGASINFLAENESASASLEFVPFGQEGEFRISLEAKSSDITRREDITVTVQSGESALGNDTNGSILANQAISEARESLERAIEAGIEPGDAGDLLEQAEYYFERGEYQKAAYLAETARSLADKYTDEASESGEYKEDSDLIRIVFLSATLVALAIIGIAITHNKIIKVSRTGFTRALIREQRMKIY